MTDLEWPFVSVIIPHYNDNERLMKCLKALKSQTHPKDRLELIVVDNGSETAPDLSEFPKATLLIETKKGSYAARNTGVRHSRGEILAFTDSDCIPQPKWIENGIKAFGENPKKSEYSAMGGEIRQFFENPERPTIMEKYSKIFFLQQGEYVEKLGFAATANIMIRRGEFLKVGYFEERLMSSGDLQWCRRLKKMGLKLGYTKESRVMHPAVKTLKKLIQITQRVAGGCKKMREYHPELQNEIGWYSIKRMIAGNKYAIKKIKKEDTCNFVDAFLILSIHNFLGFLGRVEMLRVRMGGIPKRR